MGDDEINALQNTMRERASAELNSSCAELAVELVVELAVEPHVQVFLSVSVCAGWAVGGSTSLGFLGLGYGVWRMGPAVARGCGGSGAQQRTYKFCKLLPE